MVAGILGTVFQAAVVAALVTLIGTNLQKRTERKARRAGELHDELIEKYTPARLKLGTMMERAESLYHWSSDGGSPPSGSGIRITRGGGPGSQEFGQALSNLEVAEQGLGSLLAKIAIVRPPKALRESLAEAKNKLVDLAVEAEFAQTGAGGNAPDWPALISSTRQAVSNLDDIWNSVSEDFENQRTGPPGHLEKVFLRIAKYGRRNVIDR